jgi:hypothetical protein
MTPACCRLTDHILASDLDGEPQLPKMVPFFLCVKALTDRSANPSRRFCEMQGVKRRVALLHIEKRRRALGWTLGFPGKTSVFG